MRQDAGRAGDAGHEAPNTSEISRDGLAGILGPYKGGPHGIDDDQHDRRTVGGGESRAEALQGFAHDQLAPRGGFDPVAVHERGQGFGCVEHIDVLKVVAEDIVQGAESKAQRIPLVGDKCNTPLADVPTMPLDARADGCG